MISKWMVSNFKSIREETELELAPLTIFAGANSSGKSTFIQSILLIAQTLSHNVGSRSVVLNGDFTSLGQFDDLKHQNGESDLISIKWTYKLFKSIARFEKGLSSISLATKQNDKISEIVCKISFDANQLNTQKDFFQIQPRLIYSELLCISHDENNFEHSAQIITQYPSNKTEKIKDSRFDDDDLNKDNLLDVKLDNTSLTEIKEDYSSAEPIKSEMMHFLPDSIICDIDILKENATMITTILQSNIDLRSILNRRVLRQPIFPKNIIPVLTKILGQKLNQNTIHEIEQSLEMLANSKGYAYDGWSNLLNSLKSRERTKVQKCLQRIDKVELRDLIYDAMKESVDSKHNWDHCVELDLPQLLKRATKELNRFFKSSLKYLGPLRDIPKPLYPLAPLINSKDIGLRGEHTASILELNKNKQIVYIPSANFKKPDIENKIVFSELEKAVTDWLEYLGVANSVESKDKGKLGHELKVGFSGLKTMQDLTHVGVGVSQVLPILVMCLLASPGSTLVFEQPELHLHPKVQTLLGDFFLSMALCEKQCIVETHSEYLIDRLRFRVASESKEKGLNSKIKIYFVEKPGDTSLFREVAINEYGAITDWPEGFFDQSQKEAEKILMAATKKRKAKMVGKNA